MVCLAPFWHGRPRAGDDHARRRVSFGKFDQDAQRPAGAQQTGRRGLQPAVAFDVPPQRLGHEAEHLLGVWGGDRSVHDGANNAPAAGDSPNGYHGVDGPRRASASRRGRGRRTVIDDMLASACERLGHVPERLVPLAGDASHRRFFRAHLVGGDTLVACLYPEGAVAQAERDWRVHFWAWRKGLPVPRPFGRAGVVTLVEDLGSVDLEAALAAGRTEVIGAAFAVLQRFQSTDWADLETIPFDAGFFRRELADFERLVLPPRLRGGAVAAFLDRLVTLVGGHPRRLVHRDFHVNNLFIVEDVVKAIDFQDMRGGPDTYDSVSLLRERAGASGIEGAWTWLSAAAEAMNWTPGWEERYWQCAAQRGLKVMGTFLRLYGEGREEYLRFLPGVRERTVEALHVTGAPEAICDAVASVAPGV